MFLNGVERWWWWSTELLSKSIAYGLNMTKPWCTKCKHLQKIKHFICLKHEIMKKWIYTGNPLSISSTCLNNNGYSAFSISTHAQMKTRNSAFSWKLHGTKGIRSVTCRHPTGNYNIPAVSWPIPWVYRPRSPLFHLIVWDVPRIIPWTRREENAFDHCGPLQSKTNLPFLRKAHKISNKFTLQHFSKTFVWLQSVSFPATSGNRYHSSMSLLKPTRDWMRGKSHAKVIQPFWVYFLCYCLGYKHMCQRIKTQLNC